jgi:hypothetical protein
MDERLKFIARLLDVEKVGVVCREFGISRKTGYKILAPYNAIGIVSICASAANQCTQGITPLSSRQKSPSQGR